MISFAVIDDLGDKASADHDVDGLEVEMYGAVL